MSTKSREYDGEAIDCGLLKIVIRGKRLTVWTNDGGPEPWLEKRGKTIYVVTREAGKKLDNGPPIRLNQGDSDRSRAPVNTPVPPCNR